MAKFSGKVGFVETVESRPGVWDEVVTEKQYYGDIIDNTVAMDNSDQVNSDISLQNSISIIGDAYANEKASAIRYVRWMGGVWSAPSVQIKHPRLILRLGGVWDGSTAAPDSP